MIKYVPYESTTLIYLYLAPFSYTSFFLYRSFSIKGARFFFFSSSIDFFFRWSGTSCMCVFPFHTSLCFSLVTLSNYWVNKMLNQVQKEKKNKILKFLPSVFLPSDASFVFDAFVYFSFSRESLILVANTVNVLIFSLCLKSKSNVFFLYLKA